VNWYELTRRDVVGILIVIVVGGAAIWLYLVTREDVRKRTGDLGLNGCARRRWEVEKVPSASSEPVRAWTTRAKVQTEAIIRTRLVMAS